MTLDVAYLREHQRKALKEFMFEVFAKVCKSLPQEKLKAKALLHYLKKLKILDFNIKAYSEGYTYMNKSVGQNRLRIRRPRFTTKLPRGEVYPRPLVSFLWSVRIGGEGFATSVVVRT